MRENARISGRALWSSLSSRVLLLTVAFVMLAEVLIFVPSVARYRVVWLEDMLGDAHLALLALEATPDGMVDRDLQRVLLDNAGAHAMTAWRPGRAKLTLAPDMPPEPAESYDIREREFFPLIVDAMAALVRTEPRVISVLGRSSKDPDVVVSALVSEMPMIRDMRGYGGRILMLSLVISLFTAALVFISLHLLLVRPLQRLTANMIAFRDAPEDARRVINPSNRTDEVGIAERALAEMQTRLRAALRQQARLAAVGTAVSKISHDLKGLLTTAMLESDRLEGASGDPEVKEVTEGLARALDRAVSMATKTLRFAKEGPPQVHLRDVRLHPVVMDAVRATGLEAEVDIPDGLEVYADPDLLLRALENLTRNAEEAGARHMTISARRDRGGVRVTLSDDGPGLPQKALDNLFVPFSGSARPGGTGLGLPIAREVLETMGGRLDLVATDSEGTTFALQLPQ